jgi:hypothetical protein
METNLCVLLLPDGEDRGQMKLPIGFVVGDPCSELSRGNIAENQSSTIPTEQRVDIGEILEDLQSEKIQRRGVAVLNQDVLFRTT